MFDGCQQVRAQASFFFANIIKVAALQQQDKKRLSKILRFLWCSAFSPDEAINRSPVGAAKFFQRLLSRWRLPLCFKDHAPVGGRKRSGTVLRAFADRAQ